MSSGKKRTRGKKKFKGFVEGQELNMGNKNGNNIYANFLREKKYDFNLSVYKCPQKGNTNFGNIWKGILIPHWADILNMALKRYTLVVRGQPIMIWGEMLSI